MRAPIARSLSAIVALALVLVALPATGQTLRLDPLGAGPTLPSDNAATRTAELLRGEIEQLTARNEADPTAAALRDARVALRRVAFELLARGAEPARSAQETSDVLAMQGFRLADLRRRIDLVFAEFGEGAIRTGDPPRALGVRERDRALRLARRFADNAAAAVGSADLNDLRQVDAAIATAIDPLLDLLAILEGRPGGEAIGSGWPEESELTSSVAPTHDAPAPTSPCDAPTIASLPPRTRDALTARCAAAPEGEPEFGPSDLAAIALVRAGGDLDWLEAEERDRLDADAAGRLLAGAGPGPGPIVAQAALLDAAMRLEALRGVAPVDAKALRRIIRAALLPPTDAPRPVGFERSIRRAIESIDLAIRFRAATPDDAALPRDLRPMRRDFERAYLRAEESALRDLPKLLEATDPLGDPALLGLVRGQRLAFEDLERLAAVRDLLDRIGGIRPQAVAGTTQRVRTIFRWLLEPPRRADGLAAWRAFSGQLDLFAPLPFEDAIRRETPEAIRLAAGRPRELAAMIDLLRAEWADGWSQGVGDGPAARRLHRLWRLLRVMEVLEQSIDGADERGAALLLSRWGAFYLPPVAFAPAVVDLDAQIRLAVTSALGGDESTLGRELDRLERDLPLSLMTGRLLHSLKPWAERRPGGAFGLLAAVGRSPSDSAWGLDLRTRLAAIARWARELEHARRYERRDLDQPLLEHLALLATSILDSLGSESSPVIPLPGLVEELPVPGRAPRRR